MTRTLKNEVIRTRYLRKENTVYLGRDFDPADQSENEPYQIDFVDDIGPVDTITAAVWTLIVAPGTNGNDPTPAMHLMGPPTLYTPAGTTRQTATQQQISGLLPDVLYKVAATATL